MMVTSHLINKTGLQPVSRPVEQTVGAKMRSKNVLKTNGAVKPVSKPLEAG